MQVLYRNVCISACDISLECVWQSVLLHITFFPFHILCMTLCTPWRNLWHGHAGKHSILHTNFGQQPCASLQSGATLSEQFWLHLGLPALSLQSHSHWGQPFILSLSEKPFRHRKRDIERGRSRWKESTKERGREVLLQPGAPVSSFSVNKHDADDKHEHWKNIVMHLCLPKREQDQDVLVSWYCVCALCLCHNLFRALLYSSVSPKNLIIEA